MSAARPRIRSGAILWGLVSMVVAVWILVVAPDTGRREALTGWVLDLSAGDAFGLAAIALGVLAVLIGGLTAIRRAQRRE